MIWDVIYNKLKAENIEVYTPGQHLGDCMSPYAVVRPQSSAQTGDYSSNTLTCDVLCYVPLSQFSSLEPFVLRVKAVLKTLYPQVKESHFELPGFVDESNKSHMWSIQYEGYQQFFNLS